MLPGFNHNINHQGILFHVQTEDKGVSNPLVITQLFVDGNVLATRRSSYEKFLNKPGVQEITLAMMQEQHKGMMKDLIHGRIKAALDYIENNQPSTKLSSPPPAQPNPQAPPAPAPARATMDTKKVPSSASEKTLDELILEFLSNSGDKK